MKRLSLFLFFNLLVAAAANRVWACGDSEGGHAAQFHKKEPASCCTNDVGAAHCNQNADACSLAHPGEPCPDGYGCGGCHCPGCGTVVSHAPVAFDSLNETAIPPFSAADSAQRQAFYFAEHMPEAVFCLFGSRPN
jgi:hypothetical protein